AKRSLRKVTVNRISRISRNRAEAGNWARHWPRQALTHSISSILVLMGSYTLMPHITATAIAQTTPSVTYPVLSAGSTGDTVSRLQATLKLLGFYQGSVDGNYNAPTQAAVTRFQIAAGLPADGITGPSTWRRLLPAPSDISETAVVPPVAPAEPVANTPAPAEPPTQPQGPPILRPEVEGSAVSQLQRELQQLGYYDGEIDGIYGDLTQSAVKEFQADKGLEVDAVVGPSTWEALTRALS
ncbi:MAG: peptidoglycan-binding protein, partial [Cyanobacteria bacterium J06650_10]